MGSCWCAGKAAACGAQQEESDALEATANAFLTVGFLVLLGQTHDELEGEFIVATPAGISRRWICHSATLRELGIESLFLSSFLPL